MGSIARSLILIVVVLLAIYVSVTLGNALVERRKPTGIGIEVLPGSGPTVTPRALQFALLEAPTFAAPSILILPTVTPTVVVGPPNIPTATP